MRDQSELREFYRAVLDRLRSNLPLKALLLVTVPTTTTIIYFIIQRNILFPEWKMPRTFLDRVIPFRPHWSWIYLSLYVLCPIGAVLTRSRKTLMRYAVGVAFYSMVGFICFVLFPVAAPRPAMAHGDWLYDHLIRYDRVYNSVPSLHAACGTFAVLYLALITRDTRWRKVRFVSLCVAWIWLGLILYSTIATRQHFFLDLPPGILLGWWARKLIFRLPAPFLAAVRVGKHVAIKM
jgi:membrane-associated phospholipid phosphatase